MSDTKQHIIEIMELDEQDGLYNETINTMQELIAEMHWFDIALLQEYYKCNKNALKLSRETKISYRYILRRLNKSKQNGKFELFSYPEFFNLK
jgi:translation initiation factor 2B subunit (eIF-2B alpha/beta/delta family)